MEGEEVYVYGSSMAVKCVFHTYERDHFVVLSLRSMGGSCFWAKVKFVDEDKERKFFENPDFKRVNLDFVKGLEEVMSGAFSLDFKALYPSLDLPISVGLKEEEEKDPIQLFFFDDKPENDKGVWCKQDPYLILKAFEEIGLKPKETMVEEIMNMKRDSKSIRLSDTVTVSIMTEKSRVYKLYKEPQNKVLLLKGKGVPESKWTNYIEKQKQKHKKSFMLQKKRKHQNRLQNGYRKNQ